MSTQKSTPSFNGLEKYEKLRDSRNVIVIGYQAFQWFDQSPLNMSF